MEKPKQSQNSNQTSLTARPWKSSLAQRTFAKALQKTGQMTSDPQMSALGRKNLEASAQQSQSSYPSQQPNSQSNEQPPEETDSSEMA